MSDDRYTCRCAEATGLACQWRGEISELVLIEYTPKHLRDAMAMARGSGSYPGNGALRLAVQRDCANQIIAAEGDHRSWPPGCEWVSTIGCAEIAPGILAADPMLARIHAYAARDDIEEVRP